MVKHMNKYIYYSLHLPVSMIPRTVLILEFPEASLLSFVYTSSMYSCGVKPLDGFFFMSCPKARNKLPCVISINDFVMFCPVGWYNLAARHCLDNTVMKYVKTATRYIMVREFKLSASSIVLFELNISKICSFI